MRVEENNRMYDCSHAFMNHEGGIVSATLSDSAIFAVKTNGRIPYAFCRKGEENQYTLVNTVIDIK